MISSNIKAAYTKLEQLALKVKSPDGAPEATLHLMLVIMHEDYDFILALLHKDRGLPNLHLPGASELRHGLGMHVPCLAHEAPLLALLRLHRNAGKEEPVSWLLVGLMAYRMKRFLTSRFVVEAALDAFMPLSSRSAYLLLDTAMQQNPSLGTDSFHCGCCLRTFLGAAQYFEKSLLLSYRELVMEECRKQGYRWCYKGGNRCFLLGLPEELRGDRDFLLNGASYVVEDGANSFAILDAELRADRELTAAYVSRNPDCLRHSLFLDDAEMVGLAVSFSKGACYRNLDLGTPRVRACRSVLEQAAAAGGERFYATRTGRLHVDDAHLACLAMSKAGPPWSLLRWLSPRLRETPVVLAAAFSSRWTSGPKQEAWTLNVPEALRRSKPFLLQLLAIDGLCLGLLEDPLRTDFELVLCAVEQNREAMALVRREFWSSLQHPKAAAERLLRLDRSLWKDFPDAVKELMPVLEISECIVCWTLPRQMFDCSRCSAILCGTCVERVNACPACRMPRSADHKRNFALEQVAERLLEETGQQRPAKKPRQ